MIDVIEERDDVNFAVAFLCSKNVSDEVMTYGTIRSHTIRGAAHPARDILRKDELTLFVVPLGPRSFPSCFRYRQLDSMGNKTGA